MLIFMGIIMSLQSTLPAVLSEEKWVNTSLWLPLKCQQLLHLFFHLQSGHGIF